MSPTRALPPVILLDLDDTILEDSASVDRCWRAACAAFAPHVGGVDAEHLEATIRRHLAWFWSDPDRHRTGRLRLAATRREVVAEAIAGLGCTDASVGWALADHFTAGRDAALRPFPGAVEALDALRARGVRLGLVTNGAGPVQRAKVERFGLAGRFDAIVVEGDFGAGKPDPRVYRHALALLGAEPGQAWMVGDNLAWDVAGAQAVGIHGVWHDWAGVGLPADSPVRPDRVIRSLADLP